MKQGGIASPPPLTAGRLVLGNQKDTVSISKVNTFPRSERVKTAPCSIDIFMDSIPAVLSKNPAVLFEKVCMFQGSRFTRSLRGKPFTFDSSLNQMPSRTMAPVSPQRYQSFMAGRYHRTSAVNLARSFFGEAFHPCRGSQQHLCRLSLPASHLSWPNAASSRPTPMSRRPFAPAWCSFSPGQNTIAIVLRKL